MVVNNILTDEERNSSLALNRLLESATCPACGTRQLALQETARRNAQLAQCILCGSESPQQELELLSTLRSQMADKLYAQRAAEGLVRTARAKMDIVLNQPAGPRLSPVLQCSRSVEELRGHVQLIINTDSKTLWRPGDLHIRLDAGALKSVSLPCDVLGLRHNEHIAMAYFEA